MGRVEPQVYSDSAQEEMGKFQVMASSVRLNRTRQSLECECRQYLEIPRSEIENPEKMLILKEEFEKRHKGCAELIRQVESCGASGIVRL